MEEQHYKLEMRKPTAAIKEMRNWKEDAILDTQVEAQARLTWWAEYDEHYSLSGWEYRVTQVNPKKRR